MYPRTGILVNMPAITDHADLSLTEEKENIVKGVAHNNNNKILIILVTEVLIKY